MRKIRLFPALFAMMVLAAACGQAETKTATTPASPAAPAPAATPPAPAPTSAATTAIKAEEIYKSNCMSCHGGNLEGRPGPNLQKIGSTKTKEQIVTQIAKGGGRMQGFESKLDAADIEALAAWLADKK